MACGHCGGGGGGVGVGYHSCGATTCGGCDAGVPVGVMYCGRCGQIADGTIVDWVRTVKKDKHELAELDDSGQGSSDKAKADAKELKRNRAAIWNIPILIGGATIIVLLMIVLGAHHHH